MSENKLVLDLSVGDDKFEFATSSVDAAITQAEAELQQISETAESIRALSPDCDKLDYILAASSGALCGMIDIFLVGTPGNSVVVKITDKWFGTVTTRFANVCCPDKHPETLDAAIKTLENTFQVPYDQTYDPSGKMSLSATNHHFKSLAHNPSLLGLFFSILDRFSNTSHFVSGGAMATIPMVPSAGNPTGISVVGNLFQGFVNWFGHLVSDVSGSSSTARKGNRGMGIPSPLWTWTNDVIAIKSKLGIQPSEWDKNINELSVRIFKKGLDLRAQTAQIVPVLLNDLIVRLVYAIRRLIHYFQDTPEEERSFERMWEACEPFSNATVKRMETVAHGTFCLVDTADAAIRASLSSVASGGTMFAEEFLLRLNIIGLGRFAVSLFGETRRVYDSFLAMGEPEFLERKKTIVEDYLEGLKVLQRRYDDARLLDFVEDFKCSSAYEEAFGKSAQLAKLRDVPDDKILKNKADIDKYFSGM